MVAPSGGYTNIDFANLLGAVEVEGDEFTLGQSSEPADVVIETTTTEASDDNFV